MFPRVHLSPGFSFDFVFVIFLFFLFHLDARGRIRGRDG